MRGVYVRERKRAREGSRRGDSTVRGANGEIFGSPETVGGGEKYLDRSLVLLFSLLAAMSPRSSLPSALRGGLRAHAPPAV